MDLRDVPMFYNAFNNGSPTFKGHRVWVMRIMARGLQGPWDHHALCRRHVYALLLSFADSESADSTARDLAVQLLQRAVTLWVYPLPKLPSLAPDSKDSKCYARSCE